MVRRLRKGCLVTRNHGKDLCLLSMPPSSSPSPPHPPVSALGALSLAAASRAPESEPHHPWRLAPSPQQLMSHSRASSPRPSVVVAKTPLSPLARNNISQPAATMTDTGIFSADLLSPEVQAQLPEGYNFRALRRTDYDTGFLDCLRVLTTVGDVSKAQFEAQYDTMSRPGSGYYILVVEDTNVSPPRVVGTGAVIVERKL